MPAFDGTRKRIPEIARAVGYARVQEMWDDPEKGVAEISHGFSEVIRWL
ncbi:MAG: hypothetical protein PHR28_12120 [candidate division Zixibacteria bacterium]|jgi:hypothetical protein|nr:hypothetical protein [candidate division Zixibacteria bacterium]